MTWPRWGSVWDGACGELPTLELVTVENESSSLGTPTVNDSKNSLTESQRGRGTLTAGLLPTPTVSPGRNETSGRQEGSKHHSGTTLHDVAYKMLPTPQAFDLKDFQKADLSDKTTKNGKQGGRSNLREVDFQDTVANAVVATTQTNATDNPVGSENKGESSPMLATPAAADCQGSHGGGQGRSLRTDTANYRAETGERGTLNPCFVAEMMGFPITWFDIE